MSFRVLFLRMVWVVAAALALSGCDKEDDKKTEPGDDKDKPTLAVAVDPAETEVKAGGEAKHTVKVTITSTKDADKTAEVMLSASCKGDVAAPDLSGGNGKKKAVAGVAEWKDLKVKTDEATVCEYTAKMEGAADKKGTFTVKADSGTVAPGTPALATAITLAAAAADGAGNYTATFALTDEGKKDDALNDVKAYLRGGCVAPSAAVNRENEIDGQKDKVITKAANSNDATASFTGVNAPSGANACTSDNLYKIVACAKVGEKGAEVCSGPQTVN